MSSRKHSKIRYFYPVDSYMAEIDLYLNEMKGYARVEVEFETVEEANSFIVPEWFSNEITNINHVIHEGLGTLSYKIMKDRYKARNIKLKEINFDETFIKNIKNN